MKQHTISILIITFFSIQTYAKTALPVEKMYWHTTHALEKFPCMNESEIKYFQRLVEIEKSEERLTLLADHRTQLKPSKRSPSSIKPKVFSNQQYICPPFHGVRNPHPQELEFGKASPFERIRIQNKSVQVLNGLNRNEIWSTEFNPKKGYIEGKNPRGTPINLIPIAPEGGKAPRFLVHYLLWQDKTPPSVTFCYREDLHNQCNPYSGQTSPTTKSANLNP